MTLVPATSPARAIGILGGVFDPPHLGHCALAQGALEECNLDRVLFIPAGQPPHKKDRVGASAAARAAMVRMVVADNPRFELCEWELLRDKPSYTVHTLAWLRQKYPDAVLHYLIGADNLGEISSWYRFEQILQQVTLCVAKRPPFDTTVPAGLEGASLAFFEGPQWGIASSQIRARIARGRSCRYLLPSGVRQYILEQGLYRTSTHKLSSGESKDNTAM
jgi:nicotinate-nucleotide adenylyltransferase